MRKTSFLVLAGIATVLLLVACIPAYAPSQASETHGVLAAETFLAEIAQNVAGARLKVTSLVPVGVNPEAFEPTPGDVAKVAKSDVLIVNGSGFEPFLDRLVANAGGQRHKIDASAGLASRSAREGEVAEMSEADLADAVCRAAADEKAKPVETGQTAEVASALPEESGLFALTLKKQPDGSYGGFIKYSTDEEGDFWLATGAGKIAVAEATEVKATLEVESSFAVSCGPLSQGNIVELEKDGQYVLVLSGFNEEKTTILAGPTGGTHGHSGDPHFWLDPNNVVKYVQNIRDGLSEVDPEGVETYTANANGYVEKLKELDGWIADQVKQVPEERRLLVTNHESFGYFADRYGFRIVGTIVPSVSAEAQPSARQVARLVDRIKETRAKAIFLETGTNPQLAQQVAKETGIKVVTRLYTHSTGEPGGPAATYVDMMKYNTIAIVDALK